MLFFIWFRIGMSSHNIGVMQLLAHAAAEMSVIMPNQVFIVLESISGPSIAIFRRRGISHGEKPISVCYSVAVRMSVFVSLE